MKTNINSIYKNWKSKSDFETYKMNEIISDDINTLLKYLPDILTSIRQLQYDCSCDTYDINIIDNEEKDIKVRFHLSPVPYGGISIVHEKAIKKLIPVFEETVEFSEPLLLFEESLF